MLQIQLQPHKFEIQIVKRAAKRALASKEEKGGRHVMARHSQESRTMKTEKNRKKKKEMYS